MLHIHYGCLRLNYGSRWRFVTRYRCGCFPVHPHDRGSCGWWQGQRGDHPRASYWCPCTLRYHGYKHGPNHSCGHGDTIHSHGPIIHKDPSQCNTSRDGSNHSPNPSGNHNTRANASAKDCTSPNRCTRDNTSQCTRDNRMKHNPNHSKSHSPNQFLQ